MATNHIIGDLVGVWISTVLPPGTAVYKEIVCAENSGIDGSADVNSRNTKCGVIKAAGPFGWTITGSGTNNSAPTTTQISSDELLTIAQDGTEVLVKIAHATDTSLIYRTGQGQISSFSETHNTGEPVTYDFTIDVSGDLDITP